MGESLLIITIITLVVLTVRRARPVILENPVIIQRPGHYHITLAPQLNRAQTFIEKIAAEYSKTGPLKGELPSRYYEVRDPKVFAKGADCYLLAVTLRGGLLYFQAANPEKAKNDTTAHLKLIRNFADSVMKEHPQQAAADGQGAETMDAAVEAIARQLQISVTVLPVNL